MLIKVFYRHCHDSTLIPLILAFFWGRVLPKTIWADLKWELLVKLVVMLIATLSQIHNFYILFVTVKLAENKFLTVLKGSSSNWLSYSNDYIERLLYRTVTDEWKDLGCFKAALSKGSLITTSSFALLFSQKCILVVR